MPNSPIPAPTQAQYGKILDFHSNLFVQYADEILCVGEYPWQAVLLGPGDVYQGSGVLIDPLHVLTVAHKVANYS